MFTLWWSRHSGSPVPRDEALTGPLSEMGARVHVMGDASCRIAWTAPTGAQRVGVAQDKGTGITVVAWARIDNLAEVRAALGRDRAPTAGAHVADWLLAAYLIWGEDAPQHLIGDYSVATFDPVKQRVLAWRDHIGTRPLFSAAAGEAFAVSTTAAGLTALPGVDGRINDRWVVHHSLGLTTYHHSTPYKGVHRVPPGQATEVTPDAVRTNRYHRFAATSPWRKELDHAWVAGMRHTLDTAVADRLPDEGAVAAEITAGLDSSGIVGTLAGGSAHAADRLQLFGISTYSDPEGLLTATARQHKITNVTVNPPWEADERHTIPRIDAALGYPHAHGMVTSMIPTYRQAAAVGATTLYSGHGGDQCVSSPAWKAVLEWTDRGDWLGAARMVVRPGWKAPGRAVRQTRLFARAGADQPNDMHTMWLETGIREVALADADVVEIFTQTYEGWWSRTVNGEIVDSDGHLLADVVGYWSRRAEECSVAAAMQGVEYVWPLLDVRLIQQYLSTPTVEKFHGGHNRYLFRRVIEPVVPAEVTWRPSKVPGGPPNSVTNNRGRLAEALPLDTTQTHAALAALLDPAVMACGEVGPPGSLNRMSRWRMREVDTWLRAHYGDTGAGASAD